MSTLTTNSCRLLVSAVTCLSIVACNAHETAPTNSPGAVKKDAVGSISSDAEVRCGFGIPQCHLGMTTEEILASLGPYASKKSSKTFGFEYLRYPNLGIVVGIKDDRVQRISFYFRSKDEGTFAGRLQDGFTANSTMNAFVAKYGQPLHRLESTESEFGAWPGQLDVWLFHPDLGLEVDFTGDKLTDVQVYPADEIIIPGQGTSSYYVGLATNTLSNEWMPHTQEDEFGDGFTDKLANHFFYNRRFGIDVAALDGDVRTATFICRLDYDSMRNPYFVKTPEGVSPSSTIKEVIRIYGQPESIVTSTGPDGRHQEVDLTYSKTGVAFSFIDEKLCSLSVFKPETMK